MTEKVNPNQDLSATPRAKKLLYIFSAAPYSTAAGQEGLDALLVGAAFEQDISLLFIHDGVFQLKTDQGTSGSQLKQFTKGFAAIEDFGVEDVFVLTLSMHARGLTPADLMIATTELDSAGVANLIAQQDRVFTF